MKRKHFISSTCSSFPTVHLTPKVKWKLKKHSKKLTELLYCQWLQEAYCDLQLQAKDGVLKVHSCIIAAFSPRLHTMIIKLNDQTDISGRKKRASKWGDSLCVKIDFEYNVLKTIIKALYSGMLVVNKDINMDKVLKALRWLEIEELVQTVEQLNRKSETQLYGCYNHNFKSRTENNKEELKNNKNLSTYGVQSADKVLIKQEPLDESGYGLDTYSNLNELNESSNKRIKANFLGFLHNESLIELSKQCENEMEGNRNVESKNKQKIENRKIKESGPSFLNGSMILSNGDRVETSANTDLTLIRDKDKTLAMQQVWNKSIIEGSDEMHNLVAQIETGNVEATELEAEAQVEIAKDLNLNISWEPLNPTIIVKDEQVLSSIGWKCDRCFTWFDDESRYINHLSEHRTYNCEMCGEIFYHQDKLIQHVHRQHYRNKHFKCNECSIVDFKAESELKLHFHEKHNVEHVFKCHFEGCNFSHKVYKSLTSHFQTHDKFITFKCDKCKKEFHCTHNNFNHHLKMCYGKYQPKLCDICGQSFNLATGLLSHKRTMHFKQRVYKCQVCDKTFSNGANKRRHERIHSNSFPYTCPLCKEGYRHSNMLKCHISSKHAELYEKYVSVGASITDIISNLSIEKTDSRPAEQKETVHQSKAENIEIHKDTDVLEFDLNIEKINGNEQNEGTQQSMPQNELELNKANDVIILELDTGGFNKKDSVEIDFLLNESCVGIAQ